ncbi:uncharacterized protein F4807DRAFT_442097 [Annulohypoxylon truncatum]|uniref:uncharacterized protein n=1 Tax=Annulohypoxylon truncatum TaxID=327061 RepID=UPI00200813B5|nr:uncharacterized protein F4807DRAFT_442097 [Annulohypoxylon truncatum]KAI1205733.1 hypothetical protein F4807DRAFT_442097 [Annulohypoxylon truncatum]
MDGKEGTIVALSPLDNRMIPCWVKMLFYFSMPAEAKVPETYDILRKGLNMAVADMPICGGITRPRPQDRPGWKPNQIEVYIPKDVGQDGTYPLDFKDLTSEISYEELRKDGFPMEAIDTKVLMTKSLNVDEAAGIQTTAAQANFVKGGCLLGLAMWHHTVDPYGTYIFARNWASHCRKLQTEQGWEEKWKQGLAAEKTSPQDDRMALERLWREEGGSETSVASDRHWDVVGLYPPSAKDAPKLDEVMARAYANIDPTKKVACRMFSVPGTSFQQLKRDAIAGSGDADITADDAIHALLWRCIMRVRYPEPGDELSEYQIAFNGRHKLAQGGLDSFLGDVSYFATAALPLAEVTAPSTSVGQLAQMLHKAMDSVSREDLLAGYGVVHNLPSYVNLQYNLAGIAGPTMVMVNHRHVPLAELDFGPALGSPDCERPPGEEWNDLFRRIIQLPNASGDGLEVLVTLFDDEMKRLQEDQEFMKYAKLCSY